MILVGLTGGIGSGKSTVSAALQLRGAVIVDADAIVRAILAMAHALRLDTLAEGVETERHADYLVEAGCKMAQGYLYARPMPADELRRYLASQRGIHS